jgi:hypothetical protein
MSDGVAHVARFKEAARALECKDGGKRFKERLGKLVKHEPGERLE